MPRPLIVGIDPGTTLGYAIIDLDGRIIRVGSSRVLDQSMLISEIIRHGRPVIISGDKKTTPGYISRIAAKFGARIQRNTEDLSKLEKRKLATLKVTNDHELDALASAQYAYNRNIEIIRKTKKFCSEHRFDLSLVQTMILTEPRMTFQIIRQLFQAKGQKEIRKAVFRQDFKKSYYDVLTRYSQALSDLTQVRLQNTKLKQEINEKKKPRIVKKIDKDLQASIMYKDKRLNAFGTENRNLKSGLQELKAQNESLRRLMLTGEYQAIPFAENATRLTKMYGRIIHLGDSGPISERSRAQLLRMADVIIADKKASWMKDFIVIPPKDLNTKRFENMTVVNKKELESKISGRDILNKIIKDHRK